MDPLFLIKGLRDEGLLVIRIGSIDKRFRLVHDLGTLHYFLGPLLTLEVPILVVRLDLRSGRMVRHDLRDLIDVLAAGEIIEIVYV